MEDQSSIVPKDKLVRPNSPNLKVKFKLSKHKHEQQLHQNHLDEKEQDAAAQLLKLKEVEQHHVDDLDKDELEVEAEDSRGEDEAGETKLHICPYCNQAFSCGKALRGHKRIHTETHYNNPPNKRPRFTRAPCLSSSLTTYQGGRDCYECSVCLKKFPTDKSLFGHMIRVHPEMNPNNKEEGSSSLARLNWKVTGKRGKSASYYSPEASSTSTSRYFDSRGYIGATDLMLLLAGRRVVEDFENVVDEKRARKGKGLTVLHEDKLDDDEEEEEHEAKRARKGKGLMVLDVDKLDVDEKEYEANRARKGKGLMMLDEDTLDADEVYYLKNMGLLSNTNHPNSDGDEGLIRAPLDTKFSPSNSTLKIKEKWSCNICGKTFANPQALGRHKSSHNKEKSHNVAQAHLEKYNGYGKGEGGNGTGGSDSGKDVQVGVEVNANNNIGVHQADEQRKWSCDTCGKTFLTYQALGGHKSSHNKEKNNNIAQANLRKVNDGVGFGSGVMIFGPNIDLGRVSSGSGCSSGGSREDVQTNEVVSNANNVEVQPKLCKYKTCDMTLTSEQDLRGHQSCHCVPSPEVSSSSLSYQNNGKIGGERSVLEIDLNAPLSMMEEEDGDVTITDESNLKSLFEL